MQRRLLSLLSLALLVAVLADVLVAASSSDSSRKAAVKSKAAKVRRSCGTNHFLSPALEADAHRIIKDWNNNRANERFASTVEKRGVPTIRIWWHQITSNGAGTILKPVMQRQLDVLNADYAGVYRFELAGFTRTENSTWFNLGQSTKEELEMKTALRKGKVQTLNLYTLNPLNGQVLGWATYPQGYSSNPKLDGVVIQYRTVPGGGFDPYSGGRSATHEIGHWLSLYHPFQGGCSGNNDLVNDTPPEAEPAYGCPTGRDSCPGGGKDRVRNFMDYSDDSCMTNFTPNQKVRMRSLTQKYRGIS